MASLEYRVICKPHKLGVSFASEKEVKGKAAYLHMLSDFSL